MVKKQNLAQIVKLTKKWESFCWKYDCTMTDLVIAWTAAQGTGNNVNVLCGARKVWQIEENAGGGWLALEPADVVAMRADVESIS